VNCFSTVYNCSSKMRCGCFYLLEILRSTRKLTIPFYSISLRREFCELKYNISTDNIISVIVCNKIHVKALVERTKGMPTLKTIVYTNDLVAPTDEIVIPAAPKGITIMSFEEFTKTGDVEKFPPSPPKADTTAVIMYTSGSTGTSVKPRTETTAWRIDTLSKNPCIFLTFETFIFAFNTQASPRESSLPTGALWRVALPVILNWVSKSAKMCTWVTCLWRTLWNSWQSLS